jgi:hypothetical protein
LIGRREGGPIAARWRAHVARVNADFRGRWFDDLPTALAGAAFGALLVLKRTSVGPIYFPFELPHPLAALLAGGAGGLLAALQCGRLSPVAPAFGAALALALDGVALLVPPVDAELHGHSALYGLAVAAPLLALPGALVPLARGRGREVAAGVAIALTVVAIAAAIELLAPFRSGVEEGAARWGLVSMVVWFLVLRWARTFARPEPASDARAALPHAAAAGALALAIALAAFLPLRFGDDGGYGELRAKVEGLVRAFRYEEAEAAVRAASPEAKRRHSTALLELEVDILTREAARGARIAAALRPRGGGSAALVTLDGLAADPEIQAAPEHERAAIDRERDWLRRRDAEAGGR